MLEKLRKDLFSRPWYQVLSILIVLLAILLPFAPFLVGGLLSYKVFKSEKFTHVGKVVWILIIFTTSLILGSLWTLSYFSTKEERAETPNQQQQASNTNTTPNSQQEKESSPSANGTTQPSIQRIAFKVSRVIDGDTIEIEGSRKVRYIGIDTPETVDPERPVGCYGKEASNKNKELVEGKTVFLEKDVSETDKYGRLLRYVYVGDVFVNDYLVRQGYANVSTYPPDVENQSLFLEAQKEARENNRGLWGNCSNQTSSSQSNTQPNTLVTPTPTPQPQTQPSQSCLIKGNISSSGERIYHVPGGYYYNKTQIDTGKGERWFCTEQEAINAGWRKSKK